MNNSATAFRHVWIGVTISQLGDIGFMLALPWLVLQMTGSGLALGSVMMTVAIPSALLMLLGGALSDRFPARTVLAVAYTAQALCAAAIAVLLSSDALSLPLLYLLAFSFGVADAFSTPALRVVLPELVPPEQLHRANALLQSSTQVCILAGSALGGLLIAQWGLLYLFIAEAASYGYIIVILLRLARSQPTPAPSAEAGSIVHAILDGLRYVWRDRDLRSLLINFSCINFCAAGATQVGLVVLASEHHGPTGLGLLMASAAAGSLAGLALAAKWQSALGIHARIAAASLMLSILLAALALPMPLWWLCLDAALLGAVAGFVNVGVLSWLQARVHGDMLGRVMSVLGLSSAGIVPLSLAVAGLLAKIGTGTLFLGAGGMLLLTMIVVQRTMKPRAVAPASS